MIDGCEAPQGMWLLFGVVVTVIGWLLVMVAIWTLLYANDGQSRYQGDIDRH